jgi:cytochrome c biogenesis protein
LSRPSDHIDSPTPQKPDPDIAQPRLGPLGYVRFFWRQLTSMRTALFLLLLLAIAAVPGSLFSQRSSDPNGVTQYFAENPTLAPILDKFQLFDVYTSVWFSAIYLLLFISLIGCVIPRAIHHARALRTKPPRTPAHLERLGSFAAFEVDSDAAGAPITQAAAIESARGLLRKGGYRVQLFDGKDLSVSAERGYLRETGNLVFHTALIGILLSVGIGGGFGYTGQKVLVVGQAFANVRLTYDSFNPGRFFTDSALQPYRLVLNSFAAKYEEQNLNAYGQPIDYTAKVTTYEGQSTKGTKATIKVNDPLRIGGNDIYLLGNGYAPYITVRDPQGTVVFSEPVPFLPQDANLTSLGIVKVPDGLSSQLGMRAFFYPTAAQNADKTFASTHPDLRNPELALVMYKGDLGINKGEPKSVYVLDTDKMTEIAGPDVAGDSSVHLKPGETAKIPGGLGTVTFENRAPAGDKKDVEKSVPRFASLDVHRDPTQGWVLVFAILVVAGLLTSLFIPRRRMWVKAIELGDGRLRLEYAGLARGEDPGLEAAVTDLAQRHSQALGLRLTE